MLAADGPMPVCAIDRSLVLPLTIVLRESCRPFITSTRRFSAPSCSTSPGPGNYDSTTSWQLKSSTGHKGYGPFVSISSRLSTRVTYTGPGPGVWAQQACAWPASLSSTSKNIMGLPEANTDGPIKMESCRILSCCRFQPTLHMLPCSQL